MSVVLVESNVLLRRGVLVGSDLERRHLQKPLQQVGDAFIFGRLGIVAEELASYNLSSEVSELDSQGEEQLHASATGERGYGNGMTIEQSSKIVPCHRQPRDGVGE